MIDDKHDMHGDRDKRDDKKDDDAPGRAIAAVFGSREEAHQALGALHKAHFRKVWFGVTSVATTSQGTSAMTVEDTGFFSQKSQGLVDALVERGVDGNAARQLVTGIEPGQGVVTVDPDKHDPSDAIEILGRFGGRVQTGTTAYAGSAAATRERLRDDATSTGGVDEDLPQWEEEPFYQYPAR